MAAPLPMQMPGSDGIGATRQVAKTSVPQASRADGDRRRMRALPVPHKSGKDVTVLSGFACGYQIAAIIIGHGDDAEPMHFEEFGGFASGNQYVMMHGRMSLRMDAVDLRPGDQMQDMQGTSGTQYPAEFPDDRCRIMEMGP